MPTCMQTRGCIRTIRTIGCTIPFTATFEGHYLEYDSEKRKNAVYTRVKSHRRLGSGGGGVKQCLPSYVYYLLIFSSIARREAFLGAPLSPPRARLELPALSGATTTMLLFSLFYAFTDHLKQVLEQIMSPVPVGDTNPGVC